MLLYVGDDTRGMEDLHAGQELSPELQAELDERVLAMMSQARSEAWKIYQSAPHALDLDDLISLAYSGMVQAKNRWPSYCSERGYDPAHTQYFSAYLLRRIRGSMLDAMRSQDWVTRSMRAKAKALREADPAASKSEAELSEATGLSRRQIRDTVAGVASRPVSFDGLTAAGTPHDIPDEADVESQAVVSGILAQVLGAMDRMSAETQVILAMRYHQGRDFAAIADALRTSEQRIAELHNAGVLAVHGAMLRAVT